MIEDHRAASNPLASPPREEKPDSVEIWGRRVGRTLGFAFALFLIWNLLATYVFR